MEFIIFTHGVFLGVLIMWMFKSGQEDKYEARIERICSQLVKYKEEEIKNGIIRDEFHFMKKYFERFYPNAFKKP